EELQNPYWWLPDLASLLIIVGVSFGSIYFYFASIENEINAREIEKQRLVQETALLEGDVEKFNSLNVKISALDSKKSSLQRITESKLVRYLPIILLENIQNLKPEGVWFSSVGFVEKSASQPAIPPPPSNVPDPSAVPGQRLEAKSGQNNPLTIEISGSARDNVLIAEFMMALKATQNQSFEKSDLRTQIFFSEIGISFSQVSTVSSSPAAVGAGDGASPPSTVSFKLQLNFREREPGKSEGANFSQFIEDFKRDGQAVMN
ncbi:hypothetical protein DAPPUDRAFT_124509, partial [Daphnia pulex]